MVAEVAMVLHSCPIGSTLLEVPVVAVLVIVESCGRETTLVCIATPSQGVVASANRKSDSL